MGGQTELFTHWLSNDNCLTRNAVIESYIKISQDKPLWDIDIISYNIYRKDIRKCLKRYAKNALDYEDEQILVKQKCNGDTIAFEKLICYHLSFVIHIARKYQNLGLPLNDLISAGNLGLIEAVRKIEPGSIFRISTYASFFIKSSIRNAIYKYHSQIYSPLNIQATIRKIQKITDKLNLLGYLSSTEEIAKALNMDVNQVANVLSCITSEFSIEQMRMDSNNSPEVEVFLETSFGCAQFDNEINKESLRVDMVDIIGQLSDREQNIIKMAFGIGGEEMKLEEIADKYDLTRERVRQIKEKAIRKLRGQKCENLRKYLG